jgi:hypothetical protein
MAYSKAAPALMVVHNAHFTTNLPRPLQPSRPMLSSYPSSSTHMKIVMSPLPM